MVYLVSFFFFFFFCIFVLFVRDFRVKMNPNYSAGELFIVPKHKEDIVFLMGGCVAM
jgi:hypothetical protein